MLSQVFWEAPLFTPADRDQLRDLLIQAARDDERSTGGALTGSAARDAEDRWSDIDLAFGLGSGADRDQVAAAAAWTACPMP